MTSNLGAGGDKKDVLDAVKGHFRPEFINRIDEVVVFEPLTRKDIAAVVDLQLKRLTKLLTEKRMTIELTPKAREFLAEAGYDPTYGARPLKRAIQKYLQDPLALKILGGELVPGDTVKIDAAGDALTFAPQARA
jgi:ATP-dependent Clp protease ATP-binding subunit ClpB